MVSFVYVLNFKHLHLTNMCYTETKFVFSCQTCKTGHLVHKWCSQPILNRTSHSVDLLFSAAIILSGNNYQKMATFANFLRMPFVSSSTFHKIQRTYLIPALDSYWLQEQDSVIDQLRGQEVILMGLYHYLH